jgi:deazaflavin-dependent oxidoreductase (nitroreductase family)
MSDFNQQVIKEFRANQGIVGGFFENMTLLLVHTRGAKSKELRINPVATIRVDDVQIIAASKAGADTHPDWYHNLVANPDVIVELGEEKYTAVAEVAGEPERTTLYGKIKDKYPGFADYEKKTKRVIPVVKLKRH